MPDAVTTRDSLLSERDRKLAEREVTLNSILEPGVQLTTLTADGSLQPTTTPFLFGPIAASQ